jgi:hypothetical protein
MMSGIFGWYQVLLNGFLYIVPRMWRLYKTGWIDNWIYWITHNYSVYTSYNSLQFTITLAESSLVACLPIPPDPFACNSSLKTAARPDYSLVTASRQLIVLVIAGERTTKKTLVASIVALLSNGYKQCFHCLLLTSCYGNRCKQMPYRLQHARHNIIKTWGSIMFCKCILPRVRRLHKTGIGLTIGFIGLSSITQLWLHLTVHCKTCTLIFLVPVCCMYL